MKLFKTLVIIILVCAVINTSHAQSESDKVEETCNKFINARKQLRVNDTLKIKAVVSDSLYQLLMLHYNYEKMLTGRVIRADLKYACTVCRCRW